VSDLDFSTAIQVLREKADVYQDNPDYKWLLPEHEPAGLGHVIAFELRSTADMLEWIHQRQMERTRP
jgi:hypothetical protein